MPSWRYTPEDDDRIRAAFAFPVHSIERVTAVQNIADALGRTVEAVRSHYADLMIRAERHIPTERRPFTDDEDARLLGLGPRPSVAAWAALGRSFNRSVSSMRRRLRYLKEGHSKAPDRRPDKHMRFRVPLPVAQPAWFEHQFTRDRLMAGR